MPAYKDEKRGTWYVRFRYTDWTGRRIETTKRGFARKSDAKEYEENAKKERTSADLTFGQLCNIYLEDMQPRLRKTTLQTKESVLDRLILPYFQSLPINEITPASVRKWQAEIISMKFSPTYTKQIQANLAAVFNYAVKYYGLQRNPTTIAGSIGKAHAEEMDYWTQEEFAQFISHETKPMYRALFLVLFWCGLRCGEALALTGEDIDFDARTINVSKSVSRIRGRDIIAPPKTAGSVRTVPAPSVVIDAIQDYIETLYGYKPSMKLFPTVAITCREHMNIVCRKAGVKRIRLHDLRHSHASYLINNNVPVKLISARLGHDNVETTLRTYSHMYKDTAESVTDMIENDSKILWSKCGQTKKNRRKEP